MTTQVESSSPAAVPQSDENSPFHVLMLPDGQRCDSRRKLEEGLVGDFLGKRHETYKKINKEENERDDDAVWSGASTIEKWLIWCCELPQEVPYEDGSDPTLPGALRRDRVLKFVSYLALYCHDVTSRALAISILERTLEADLPAMEMFDAHQAEAAAAAAAANNNSNVNSTDSTNSETQSKSSSRATPPTPPPPSSVIPSEGTPTTRGRKRMIEMAIESPSLPPSDDTNMKTAATLAPPPRKPDRLLKFLAAGGLKILDQWVDESSKPIPLPKAPPSSSTSSSRSNNNNKAAVISEVHKESPTGALLLPLLHLLRNLPFDKSLVTQCKINRQIRKLSKDIDAIIIQAESTTTSTKKTKKLTHPRAGGLPVVDVQEALNELKASWNAQQKLPSEQLDDPFQAVREALEEKLREVQDCSAGNAPAPAWLVKIEEEQSQKSKAPPAKKKRGMSTEEMNRIEHQQERNRLLKEDLQQAAEQRQQLLKKLREYKEKQAENGKRAAAEAYKPNQKECRRIQWKDGLGRTSKSRKRDELEEVFVFLKNSTAAAGTVNGETAEMLEEMTAGDEDGVI